jgi:hypothetical protein
MNKLEKEIFEMEQELGVPSNLRWHNTKPKKDTIEEIAEKLTKDFPHYSVRESMDDSDIKGWFLEALQKGYNLAQQQDKKLYSEQEVIELLQKALTHKDDGETGSLITAQGEIRPANFFSWFERFKKK